MNLQLLVLVNSFISCAVATGLRSECLSSLNLFSNMLSEQLLYNKYLDQVIKENISQFLQLCPFSKLFFTPAQVKKINANRSKKKKLLDVISLLTVTSECADIQYNPKNGNIHDTYDCKSTKMQKGSLPDKSLINIPQNITCL